MQIITVLWGISILLAVLGGIPYAIWMVRSAMRKNWRKVGILVVLPLGFFALLAGTTVIVEFYAQGQYVKNTYDSQGDLGDPIFKYDPERSFNGDGVSLYIFELPAPIRQRFGSPDTRLKSDFPKRPHYRDGWSEVSWTEAPLREEHKKYFAFALYASSTHTQDLLEALSRAGTFYSFFHYDHGDHPGNVDFFVVDLEAGRIYEINVNT
ncbi:hypothetical protein [Persicirhabdus sediminis]|uniref:Uncharacterized protein n=1 Tax=Persicirhabdus sediminis TaxID=454144 RepID=A0A8J7MCP4_9BACT|nr:hypothetical protein [Persicirhabdus sediminis]MBK1790055.1 hypothetical protein [Persicirhabdus sediminis]